MLLIYLIGKPLVTALLGQCIEKYQVKMLPLI